MQKFLARFAVAAFLAASGFAPAWATIIPVFNTANDSAGAVPPPGSTEIHYNLIGQPIGSSTTLETRSAAASCVADNLNSGWVNPTGTVHPAGLYVVEREFVLPGNPATALLTGSWSAGGAGILYLNNNVLSVHPSDIGPTCGHWTDFVVPQAAFVPGMNTFRFEVVVLADNLLVLADLLRVEFHENFVGGNPNNPPSTEVAEPPSSHFVLVLAVGLFLIFRRYYIPEQSIT